MWQWIPISSANRFIYLSYAAGGVGRNGTLVARAHAFQTASLCSDLEVIYAVPRTTREPSIFRSRPASGFPERQLCWCPNRDGGQSAAAIEGALIRRQVPRTAAVPWASCLRIYPGMEPQPVGNSFGHRQGEAPMVWSLSDTRNVAGVWP